MHTVYLLLGSNIDPLVNMVQAIKFLSQQTQLNAASTVWETLAMGSSGPNFLNAAVLLHTPLDLDTLRYRVLRPIEARLGRVRSADKNAPRPIDLDVLLFDEEPVEKEIFHRLFVAVPLAELRPDLLDPQTGQTLAKTALALQTGAFLRPWPDVHLLSPTRSEG